jgi:hypothetical protein
MGDVHRGRGGLLAAVALLLSAAAPQAPPPITALPNSGIQTDENGTAASVFVTLNSALSTGQSITFTVTSSNPGEGVVSGLGQGPAGTIGFTLNGPLPAGTTFPITVTGTDDAMIDGPQPYSVTVTFTSTQTAPFSGFTIPPLQCTNLDNDVAGAVVSRTSGLVTTESGGTDNFVVVLTSQPTSTVTLSLTSSNPAEGTVFPTSLLFTPAPGPDAWNMPHVVTVTGVDDALLDQTGPYTIVTGALASSDSNFNGLAVADVSCENADDESPNDFGLVAGGCGLLGPEALLLVLLLRGRRRRRGP